MAVYADHPETETGLEKGIPPVATPIGELLFRAGCVWFKNFYFPEGYKEGEVKLQGEKPVDKRARKKALREIDGDLKEFVNTEGGRGESIFKSAIKRAEKIVKTIESEIGKQ